MSTSCLTADLRMTPSTGRAGGVTGIIGMSVSAGRSKGAFPIEIATSETSGSPVNGLMEPAGPTTMQS